MTVEPVLAALLATVVALNVALSVAVVRSGTYSRSQVCAQFALIWGVPVLGALLVGLVLWSLRPPTKAFRSGNGADPDNWESGDGGRAHGD